GAVPGHHVHLLPQSSVTEVTGGLARGPPPGAGHRGPHLGDPAGRLYRPLDRVLGRLARGAARLRPPRRAAAARDLPPPSPPPPRPGRTDAVRVRPPGSPPRQAGR